MSVDLDSALQGEDATVDLQSDQPIVAGVRQRHPGVDASAGSLEELSFTAGAALISGDAAVTGLPAERSTGVTVWLTAPDDIITIERAPEADMAEMESSAEPNPTDASAEPTTVPSGEPAADDSLAPSAQVSLRILAASPEGEALPVTDDIVVSVARGRLVAVDIPRPEGAAWFTVVATVINGVVGYLVIRAGRRARSLTLVADGKHLMTDVWTSGGVIVAVLPRAEARARLADLLARG